MFDDHYKDIIQFFSTSYAPTEFTTAQKKQLVVWVAYFQFIVRQLYKMGPDDILRRYVLEHELPMILNEAHAGVAGGHYIGKYMVCKVLQAGL